MLSIALIDKTINKFLDIWYKPISNSGPLMRPKKWQGAKVTIENKWIINYLSKCLHISLIMNHNISSFVVNKNVTIVKLDPNSTAFLRKGLKIFLFLLSYVKCCHSIRCYPIIPSGIIILVECSWLTSPSLHFIT